MVLSLRKFGGKLEACFRPAAGHSFGAGATAGAVGRALLSPLVLGVLAIAFTAAAILTHLLVLHYGAGAMLFPLFPMGTVSVATALRDKRGGVIDRAKAILATADAANRELTVDERKQYDALIAEQALLLDQIELRERQDKLEAGLHEVQNGRVGIDGRVWVPPRDAVDRAIVPALIFRDNDGREIRALRNTDRVADLPQRNLPDGVKPEELDMGRYLRALHTGDWGQARAEQRAMGVGGPATLGGFAVPSPLAAGIIDIARNQATVSRAGAITLPMTASTQDIARVTGDVVPSWKTENATASDTGLTFGRISLRARTLIGLVKMSVELIEDASNLGDLVMNALGQAIGLELDRVALRGKGSDEEPLGINGWTVDSAASIQTIDLGTDGHALNGYTDFSKAIQKVAEVNGPGAAGCAAIYAPRTAGDLDRLVDTLTNPLRAPESWQTLGGKFVTNQIPVNLHHGAGTTCSEAYVGAFNNLMIGMRTGLTLEISREAGDSTGGAFSALQVWIRAYLRADIALLRPNQFVYISGILASS